MLSGHRSSGSLRERAKALPTRFRGARVQIPFDPSARALASQPWFLFDMEPDSQAVSALQGPLSSHLRM